MADQNKIYPDTAYTEQQAADFLNLSVRTVQRLPLKRIRISKRLVRYRGADIIAYLDACAEQHAA